MNLFKMNRLYSTIIFFLIMVPLSYSYAITPEQILKLKKAGVSNKVIQIMLEQEREGIKTVKDKQGNVYIIYSSGKSSERSSVDIEEEEKVKKAWKMLEESIIDTRQ